VTEAELQAAVVEAAKWLNFFVYHTYDSRRSEKGWPDLVLVNRTTGHTMFRELKSSKGKLTPSQRQWLHYLGMRNDVGVWTPEDWSSGRVLAELRGTTPQQVTA
jgi:hypothetical protein